MVLPLRVVPTMHKTFTASGRFSASSSSRIGALLNQAGRATLVAAWKWLELRGSHPRLINTLRPLLPNLRSFWVARAFGDQGQWGRSPDCAADWPHLEGLSCPETASRQKSGELDARGSLLPAGPRR